MHVELFELELDGLEGGVVVVVLLTGDDELLGQVQQVVRLRE